MARLNMLKMIGLVLLLAIALTLPSVLPSPNQSAGGQIAPPNTGYPQHRVIPELS